MTITAAFSETGTYHARDDRLLTAALTGGSAGIVTPGALAVTQTTTASAQLNVAAGQAVIPARFSPVTMGSFLFTSTATEQVTIDATSSLPRWDYVLAEVRDAEVDGAITDSRLVVVKGTAAASPAYPSLSGYESYTILAGVQIPASTSAITTAMIVDLRSARAGTLGGIIVCNSAARPASPSAGQKIFETDTNLTRVYNGSAWKIDTPQRGSVTITMAGTAGQTGSVTFPVAYAAAPIVQLTSRDGSNFDMVAICTNSTATSFSWRVVQRITANVTGTVILYWTAHEATL